MRVELARQRCQLSLRLLQGTKSPFQRVGVSPPEIEKAEIGVWSTWEGWWTGLEAHSSALNPHGGLRGFRWLEISSVT